MYSQVDSALVRMRQNEPSDYWNVWKSYFFGNVAIVCTHKLTLHWCECGEMSQAITGTYGRVIFSETSQEELFFRECHNRMYLQVDSALEPMCFTSSKENQKDLDPTKAIVSYQSNALLFLHTLHVDHN